MERFLLLSPLAVLFAGLALAAPVPLARTATAEFTVSATGAAAVRYLTERFRSHAFLGRVLMTATPDSFPCLKGETDRVAWLAAHLQVEVVKGSSGTSKDPRQEVRVRLVDCPSRDVLPLLKTVARVHEEMLRPERQAAQARLEQHERRQEAIKRILVRGNRQVLIANQEETAKQISELKAKLSSGNILKQPRRVRTVR